MKTFIVGSRNITVYPSSVPGAPVIYLNTFSEEGQMVFEMARNHACTDFSLVTVSNLDWNHDMTPWSCPPVFKNASPCTGGADDYLQILTQEIIPATEQTLPKMPVWRGIVGYSLAGLFALYSVYHTDVFSRVGSVSGSLWFPGIKKYLFFHEPKASLQCIYFSLGDRECKTRNSSLQTVEQNTRELQCFYEQKGISTVFQMNPGNHYDHAPERTAASIAWILKKKN